MKQAITIILISVSFIAFGQSADNKITLITAYSEKVDSLINNSDGSPGGVFSNIVTAKRNVRAIGVQETKIIFYYMQKDDSVYDNGKSVQYIPRNSPPLKISIEYNIAASQRVSIAYYFDKELNYYKFISTGEYGYNEERYWFDNSNPLGYEKYEAVNSKPTVQRNDKFSKEEYSNAILVLDHAREYKTLYETIFKAEQLDK